MSESSRPDIYFSKHLFRTGLQCPTRLFYKASNYPENRQPLPFIAHYRYNKKQLKSLFKSRYPKGIQIDRASVERAYRETRKRLQKDRAVLFDAVFIHGRFMAKVPVLEKDGHSINVYRVQTKAFQRGKHSISHRDGRIYSKWRDYIIDFAFQVHIMCKCYPEWKVRPFLVLPAKYARAKIDGLHKVIREIRTGKVDPQKTGIAGEKLLLCLDVSEEIEQLRSGLLREEGILGGMTFDEVLETLANRFYNKEKPPVTIGSKCKGCEFRIERERVRNGEQSGFVECWNSALGECLDTNYKPSVFELIGPGTNHWIERGIYFQEDVPDGEFYDVATIQRTKGRINEKQRQSLQIMQAKGKTVPKEIVKPNLFRELNRWEYPIHFLDFEAGNYTIPIRKGRKPYHLVVFQYSCHTLHEDGSWTHEEWIDKPNGIYPNYEMVRRLKEVPHITDGTIVQYSNFERNALKTIRKELSLEQHKVKDAGILAAWLNEIIHRHDSSRTSGPYLADLSRLVKHFYYNHKMEDSLSIKDVLQSVLTVSPRLKELYSRPYNSSNFESFFWWQQDAEGNARSPYQLMLEEQENGVRRGTEAMVVYAQLLSEELDASRKKAHVKALLRYCEVDTLAMLMIYQHWKYLME